VTCSIVRLCFSMSVMRRFVNFLGIHCNQASNHKQTQLYLYITAAAAAAAAAAVREE
jgi:hypothetical protein